MNDSSSNSGVQMLKETVLRCARCGLDHTNLEFRLFIHPIEDFDGTVWAWWALCPTTQEPVLLRQHETNNHD